MATKIDSETVFQGFTCPICHQIFKNATILECGHTYCKGCLQEYAKNQDGYFINCIICKGCTVLGEHWVDGLTPNLSVQGLEDAVHVKVNDLWSKYCPLHRNVFKDIFCEACKDFICLTCFLKDHQGHRVKKKEELEKDVEKKRKDMSENVKEIDACLERYSNNIEQLREGMHSHLSNLETEVRDTSMKKIRDLQENEQELLRVLDFLKKDSENQSGNYTARYRQLSDTIANSIGALSNQTTENLDQETLKEQYLHGQQLKTSLEQAINENDLLVLRKGIESRHFRSADDALLSLGQIQLEDQSTTSADRLLSATSDVSFEEIRREAGSSSPVRRHVVHVVNEFYLRDNYIAGMAALSHSAVVIGYGGVRGGSDGVFLSGKIKQYLKESIGDVCDIAFLTDGRLVASQNKNTCHVYSNDGSKITGMKYICKRGAFSLRFCTDHHDNIYAVNNNREIYIFHGRNSVPQRTVPTGDIRPRQICVTKTGVMITSTCNNTPSTVTVFDQEGNVGSSITAEDDQEYLYTAVDSFDRMFVARVRERSNIFRLSKYGFQGTTLIDHVSYEEIYLPHLTGCSWYYMVSLSPNLLALANGPRLYFVELTLHG